MEHITLGQIAAAIGVITVIGGFLIAIIKWFMSIIGKITSLEKRVTDLEQDSITNKKENALLLKGQLACLKGLREQGCDGPVTQSIGEIETYLLEQAHR